MDDTIRLIDAICKVYDQQDLRPHNGITYCNMAIQRIMSMLGYDFFKGMLANDIIDYMEKYYNEWVKMDMSYIQGEANMGKLIIAGSKGEEHGHVCVIRPGKAVRSNKWQRYCPVCMNIGKTCFISKGVNWAFNDIPNFYVFNRRFY